MTLPCSSLRCERMFIQLTLRSKVISKHCFQWMRRACKFPVWVNVHHRDLGPMPRRYRNGTVQPLAWLHTSTQLEGCLDKTQVLGWDVQVFVCSICRDLTTIKASTLNSNCLQRLVYAFWQHFDRIWFKSACFSFGFWLKRQLTVFLSHSNYDHLHIVLSRLSLLSSQLHKYQFSFNWHLEIKQKKPNKEWKKEQTSLKSWQSCKDKHLPAAGTQKLLCLGVFFWFLYLLHMCKNIYPTSKVRTFWKIFTTLKAYLRVKKLRFELGLS